MTFFTAQHRPRADPADDAPGLVCRVKEFPWLSDKRGYHRCQPPLPRCRTAGRLRPATGPDRVEFGPMFREERTEHVEIDAVSG